MTDPFHMSDDGKSLRQFDYEVCNPPSACAGFDETKRKSCDCTSNWFPHGKEQRRGHPEGAVAPRHLLRSGDNARRKVAAGVPACREKHACGGEKQKSWFHR